MDDLDKKLKDSLIKLKEYYLDEKERLENEVEYAKVEIDIHLESMKEELDQIGLKIKSKLDSIKFRVLNETFNAIEVETFVEEIIQPATTKEESVESKISTIESLSKKFKQIRRHISFSPSDLQAIDFNDDFLGNIQVAYENSDRSTSEINDHLQKASKEIIMTNYDNFKLLSLPNNTLLSAIFNTTNSKTHLLAQYNTKFQQIKMISKLSNRDFNVTDMATNGVDRIYITHYNENAIYACDLEFNLVSYVKTPNGCETKEFDGPYGVAYSNKNLYVCDSYNERIKKLDSNTLETLDCFKLDYQAFDLKSFGVNNQMLCVKSDKTFKFPTSTLNSYSFFSYNFYNLQDGGFTFMSKLETDADMLLVPVVSNLYLFENNLNRFYCFNANCELIEMCDEAEKKKKKNNFYCSSGVHFNKKFIFCDEIKKILIII